MALDLWFSPLWDQLADAHPSTQHALARAGSSNPTDIVETADAFLFSLEAPGFRPDDINIDLKEDAISISGKHAVDSEAKGDGGRVVRRESRRREFSRTFGLPSNVKADDITATLEHGILKVTVPKHKEAAKSRRVAITSGGGSNTTAQPAIGSASIKTA